MTTRMLTTSAEAVPMATKTMAATAGVWVVAHPCCLVRLARRGAQKIVLQRQSGDSRNIFSRQANLLHLIKAKL
jgi:hypothetical protein